MNTRPATDIATLLDRLLKQETTSPSDADVKPRWGSPRRRRRHALAAILGGSSFAEVASSEQIPEHILRLWVTKALIAAVGATEAFGKASSVEMLAPRVTWDREALAALGLEGIQIGCGDNLLEGILNCDATRISELDDRAETRPGSIAMVEGRFPYLQHDVTQRLPLADGAVRWVYSEHMIEHIPLEQAIELLREARRVVAPGGVVRLSTPDLALYVEGWSDPQQRFYKAHRERMTETYHQEQPARRSWMLNQIFYLHGHRWIYDFEELLFAATQAGFPPSAVRRCSFREGKLAEIATMDQESRRDESLYVELDRE